MKEYMRSKNPIRILLVEDHPIYREGLQLALSFSGVNCTVVASVANVQQALAYIEANPDGIDLVMLDFFLPDGNGSDVLKVVKSRCPQAKVLIVTSATEAPEVGRLMGEGVSGIISKDVQSSEVADIVLSVMRGNLHFNSNLSFGPSDADSGSELTQREMEIIRYCAQGKSAREIADALGISRRTAEHHKENIYNKLGINSSSELLKFAIQKGLI